MNRLPQTSRLHKAHPLSPLSPAPPAAPPYLFSPPTLSHEKRLLLVAASLITLIFTANTLVRWFASTRQLPQKIENYSNIEISFQATHKPENGVNDRNIQNPLLTTDTLEPVYVEGMLAYYSGAHYHGGRIQNAENFDRLKEGMTIREIVSLLGPGAQDKFTGVGSISWRCDDGRILLVSPTSHLNEKARYYITLYGEDQRQSDVAELTRKLISSIKIEGQKVAVTLSQDTYQAKAGQTKLYDIGHTFQKTDPLPSIDFTILKVEGNDVHCQYNYTASPNGLLHYHERGIIILRILENQFPTQSH